MPSHVIVKVRAKDLPAVKDFVFFGVGAAQASDEFDEPYGGVLFGYNERFVRLWAPYSTARGGYGYDYSDRSSSGHIINVGPGWGRLTCRKGTPQIVPR